MIKCHSTLLLRIWCPGLRLNAVQNQSWLKLKYSCTHWQNHKKKQRKIMKLASIPRNERFCCLHPVFFVCKFCSWDLRTVRSESRRCVGDRMTRARVVLRFWWLLHKSACLVRRCDSFISTSDHEASMPATAKPIRQYIVCASRSNPELQLSYAEPSHLLSYSGIIWWASYQKKIRKKNMTFPPLFPQVRVRCSLYSRFAKIDIPPIHHTLDLQKKEFQHVIF